MHFLKTPLFQKTQLQKAEPNSSLVPLAFCNPHLHLPLEKYIFEQK